MFKNTSNEFLKRAEALAKLIFGETETLSRTPLKNVGLGTLLTLYALRADAEKQDGKDKADYSPCEPKIHELILFGSVARGDKNPEDIDLMILDNGHFSSAIPSEKNIYSDVSRNLSFLMNMWFGINEEELAEILGDIKVDLLVQPIGLLQSASIRADLARQHRDEFFYKNVFGSAMRFDRELGYFVPLTLDYLEKTYNCCLDDLR
jgi:hypothetical protein